VGVESPLDNFGLLHPMATLWFGVFFFCMVLSQGFSVNTLFGLLFLSIIAEALQVASNRRSRSGDFGGASRGREPGRGERRLNKRVTRIGG